MTIDQAIARAFLHAQRKPVAPSSGTTKYNALLGIADSMQKLWQSEPDTEWDSLYSVVTNGTVTATDTFDLDDSIEFISKREGDYILLTNGTTTKQVKLVKPNQLYEYRYHTACAQIGRQLKFSKAFVSTDSTFGYNITIPAMLYTDDITTGSQLVQVDDPMWLVYSMAAEFIRNDVVKQNQYDNLLALADQIMQRMKQANQGQYEAIQTGWTPAGESWV